MQIQHILLFLSGFAFLFVFVFLFSRYGRKQHSQIVVDNSIVSASNSEEIPYQTILDSFYKFDSYFAITLTADKDKVDFWFGIGMFSKLQLNIVKFNGETCWIGRHYLDIGGPSLQLPYILDYSFFDKNGDPNTYLYNSEDNFSFLKQGIRIQYKIDNSLRKTILIDAKGLDHSWRYREKEKQHANVAKIIADKPVKLSPSVKRIQFQGISEIFNNNQQLEIFPDRPLILKSNSKVLVKLNLGLSFDFVPQDFYKRNPVPVFNESSLTWHFTKSVRQVLSLQFHGWLTSEVSYMSENREFIKIPLATSNFELGEFLNQDFIQYLKLKSVVIQDEEFLEIDFTPCPLLQKDYLLVWVS